MLIKFIYITFFSIHCNCKSELLSEIHPWSNDIILYKAGGVGLESKLPLITVLIKKLDEHIQVFKAWLASKINLQASY
jgi:hypothetical protein